MVKSEFHKNMLPDFARKKARIVTNGIKTD
jgi:hypothetical protein